MFKICAYNTTLHCLLYTFHCFFVCFFFQTCRLIFTDRVKNKPGLGLSSIIHHLKGHGGGNKLGEKYISHIFYVSHMVCLFFLVPCAFLSIV